MSQSLRSAARDAWIYGLPLIEHAGSRDGAFKRGQRPGELRHSRQLVTPANQVTTSSNNDTLFSLAWFNLANGPATLTIPPMGDRYYSVALMDTYTNNFTILGTRTIGGNGGSFTLVGPGAASLDPKAIRSPTPWVHLLVRMLIDGDADLAAANALQDRFRLEAPTTEVPVPTVSRNAPWHELFTGLQRQLLENPPPATDTAILRRMAPLGFDRPTAFDRQRFTAADIREIEGGIGDARSMVVGVRRQGAVFDNWLYNKSTAGQFGQDYLYRAQYALSGIAGLPNVEAIYPRPITDDGKMIWDSAKSWRLRFPAGKLPPVAAFWSLTMYEATPGGQFFFFANTINRYAIGDRTPGLTNNADGSLDIWISRSDPGGSRTANWLPAPPERPFSVALRAYLPKTEFVEGIYRLPPLVPV